MKFAYTNKQNITKIYKGNNYFDIFNKLSSDNVIIPIYIKEKLGLYDEFGEWLGFCDSDIKEIVESVFGIERIE